MSRERRARRRRRLNDSDLPQIDDKWRDFITLMCSSVAIPPTEMEEVSIRLTWTAGAQAMLELLTEVMPDLSDEEGLEYITMQKNAITGFIKSLHRPRQGGGN